MTSNDYLTLHLLKSALWNTDADLNLFKKGVDWDDILRIAEKQGVVSLVASAIRRLEDLGLNEDILPNKIINKCVKLQFFIINFTSSVIPTLNNVVNILRENDIDPVLLKGQAVAAYYLKPEFRYCGDIDLYLGNDKVNRAVELFKNYIDFEDEDDSEYDKHFNMRWNGTEVELHRSAIELIDTKDNRDLYEWTEYELNNNTRQMKIGVAEVTVPSQLFNSIYVFHHLWWHFVNGGTGIRQFCDWTMCLYRVSDDLDVDELKSLLKRFGLLNVWQTFGHVAVEQLGLPREKFPLYSRKKKFVAKMIASVAMEYGNFGKEKYQQLMEDSFTKSLMAHKWKTAVYHNKTKFWCYLASPRATWPVIKKFYKNLFSHYFRECHQILRNFITNWFVM